MRIAPSALRGCRMPAAALLCLSVAGCAAFRADPVPAPPPPPDSVAPVGGVTPSDAREWLKRDEAGAVTAFKPLEQARDAVSRVAGSDAVAAHAAESLAAARDALERAEKTWQAVASAPLEQPDTLGKAAHLAHQAQRHAQIARNVGLRESGLQQVADAQNALAERDAEDERWVGRTLIPGTFGEVRFSSGTAALTDDSQAAVAKLADFLREHERYRLRLTGHTDDTAPSASNLQDFTDANPELAERKSGERARVNAYNQAMSRRRAEAVRQALVAAGIRGERLQVEARGASDPIADNATAAGRSQNRRVVAVVVLPENRTGG